MQPLAPEALKTEYLKEWTVKVDVKQPMLYLQATSCNYGHLFWKENLQDLAFYMIHLLTKMDIFQVLRMTKVVTELGISSYHWVFKNQKSLDFRKPVELQQKNGTVMVFQNWFVLYRYKTGILKFQIN